MATATPDIAPRGARQVRAWLQAVLDRPLTSYHLVLGSASMLLALGLMMVLSASSVSAYLTFDDSYYYVKRQAMFMVVGVIGAVALARLPHSVLRVLGWLGVALATVLLILTYTTLGFESGGNRNWIDLGFTYHPAVGVRQARHDHLGCGCAGPQGQAAGAAASPAVPVPAGLSDVDLAGGLPG